MKWILLWWLLANGQRTGGVTTGFKSWGDCVAAAAAHQRLLPEDERDGYMFECRLAKALP